MPGSDELRKRSADIYRVLERFWRTRDVDRYVEEMARILAELYGADASLLAETPVNPDDVLESFADVDGPDTVYCRLKALERVRERYLDMSDSITWNIVLGIIRDMAVEYGLDWADVKEIIKKYTDYYKGFVANELVQLFCEGIIAHGLDPVRVDSYVERHIDGIAEGIFWDIHDYRKPELEAELKKIAEVKARRAK